MGGAGGVPTLGSLVRLWAVDRGLLFGRLPNDKVTAGVRELIEAWRCTRGTSVYWVMNLVLSLVNCCERNPRILIRGLLGSVGSRFGVAVGSVKVWGDLWRI